MMGAAIQYGVFAVAGSLAAGVIVASIRPEVARIRAILRWQEHDRRAFPLRAPPFGRKGVTPRRGPVDRFLRDMSSL